MSGLWAPILAGFPNPVGWVIDKVTGFVGGVATAGFEALIGGLAAWVTDAVVWVIGGVFDFFIDAADPNVQADWFVADDGPYGTTAVIGAALLLLFLLAGITQGVLAGDVAGMLRRVALDLPVSVLGMVGLVTVTQGLIRLTDQLSSFVLGNVEDDIADFTAVVTSLSSLSGGAAAALVVVLLGLVSVLAGLILVAELAVRGALIYIVVTLAPLVFAARLWPSLEGVAKKLLQLLVALILSKLAMAVALAVAASAAVGTGSGGEVTALPPPEVFAEDPGGSVTQAVGVLLAAVVAFGVAAFSPLLVSRLLPLAEAAVVAQGVRGMPVRGGVQAASLAYYTQGLTGVRLARLAQGGSRSIGAAPGPPGTPPAGPSSPLDPGPGSPPGPDRGGAGGAALPVRWRPVPNRPDPTPVPAGAGALAASGGAGVAAAAVGVAATRSAAGFPPSGGAPTGAGSGAGSAGGVASAEPSSLRAAVAAQHAGWPPGAGGEPAADAEAPRPAARSLPSGGPAGGGGRRGG